MTAWRRFVSRTPAERMLLVRAATLLVLVRVGLWVMPLGTLRRALTRVSGRRGDRADDTATEPGKIGWAVTAAAQWLPAMTCLVQALTADVLLKRAGRSSELTLGVGKTADGKARPLDAHAWVVCDGLVVVGDRPDLGDYTPLTTLGGW